MNNPCPTCGREMVKFENPVRYICPNESGHQAIRADRTGIGSGRPQRRSGGKKKK